MFADRVEDNVVRLAVPGEVLLRVVDHPVGSERSHELEVLRAAYRGDVGFEVFGQLHPGGADSPRRAVDEDPLPFPKTRPSQTPHRIESSVANRRSFLQAHTDRQVRDSRALPHADELRVRPEPEPTRPEDVVTDFELVDGCADCLDLSRQLAAEDPLLRSADPRDGAADERDGQATASIGFTSRAVRSGDCRSTDPDEDLVHVGYRSRDVFESENVWGPVVVVHHRPHESAAASPSTLFHTSGSHMPTQLRLNGGYRSVTNRNEYAPTRRLHRPTPTTKSKSDRG